MLFNLKGTLVSMNLTFHLTGDQVLVEFMDGLVQEHQGKDDQVCIP